MTQGVRRLIPISVIPLFWVSGSLLAPRSALAASAVEKLQESPLDQVQVTDTYQKGLFATDVAYINSTIDADRLLNGFKAMSTNTAPSNLYGGWENSLIRGHTIGHWLFTTTASGNDTMNGKHANTTTPKFIGGVVK